MTYIVIMVIMLCAIFGVLLGIVMRKNGVTPYGIGNFYGKHHAKDLGVEADNTSDRWDT